MSLSDIYINITTSLMFVSKRERYCRSMETDSANQSLGDIHNYSQFNTNVHFTLLYFEQY